MANVIVVGGGMGGLSTAMLLARDGHQVTVLERDAAAPPSEVDEAWAAWERPGVNQFRMLQFLLPRWRVLIERELPEVAVELEAQGGLRYNLVDRTPVGRLGPRRDDDDRFTCLTGRRPVVEAVLARVADRVDGLAVRRGVGVVGLLTGDAIAGVPTVVGVRTADGDELRADLVVDAGGRRSPMAGWLEEVGATRPAEEIEDSGFVYYGRHFRSSDGSIPECQAGLLTPHGSVSLLTLPADNGTWSVGIIATGGDAELRGLRDNERWDTALATFPLAAHWAEGEPMGDVAVMAKIEDRRRRFVVDGRPVAGGVVAVADAWACTNPSLGRGASIGLMHGCALRDLLREVSPSDPVDLVRRWDDATEATVRPWYDVTLAFDRHRLAEMQACRDGRAYEGDPAWDITNAFRKAAQVDLDVFRAFARVMSVLDLPEQAVGEPGIFEKILELAPGVPDLPGPDRAELVAIAAGQHAYGGVA